MDKRAKVVILHYERMEGLTRHGLPGDFFAWSEGVTPSRFFVTAGATPEELTENIPDALRGIYKGLGSDFIAAPLDNAENALPQPERYKCSVRWALYPRALAKKQLADMGVLMAS